MYDKKGESLVEVVVALGILAFMYMGVVNLIVGSITLNMSAKQRTQAISAVQKNLNTWMADNRADGSCLVAGVIGYSAIFNESATNCSSTTLTQTSDVCTWLQLSTLETGCTPGTSGEMCNGISDANSIKLTAHGKWYTRIMGEQTFEVSQIIRKQ